MKKPFHESIVELITETSASLKRGDGDRVHDIAYMKALTSMLRETKIPKTHVKKVLQSLEKIRNDLESSSPLAYEMGIQIDHVRENE